MLRRIATLIVVAATALAMTATPALAGSMYFYKESSKAAQTDWIQVDGIETGTSPLGNVHVGSLYAYQTSPGKGDVFAFIDDWDCQEGELPDGGGHGFEFEEEPTGCDYVGSRFGEGFALDFTIDKKLATAKLTGQLTVYGGGHGDGGVIGRPMANITWTGVGSLIKQSSTWSYDDGTSSYTDRYRSTDRAAVMSGNLGPMGFDPDLSGGLISKFSSMSKGRTK